MQMGMSPRLPGSPSMSWAKASTSVGPRALGDPGGSTALLVFGNISKDF